MKYVIGLDISTSVVGVVVLDTAQRLILAEAIVTKPSDTFWQKADLVRAELMRVLSPFAGMIKGVYVEENLQRFRPGFTSASVLMTLAKMNGLVSYFARQILNLDPIDINVNNARKTIGCKIIKKTKANPSPLPTKEQVIRWTTAKEPTFPWKHKILKSGPRKGQKVMLKCCEDMADAYIIAKAGLSIYP